MIGNYHVRFLGDKGGVIRLSYPTEKETSHLTRHIMLTIVDGAGYQYFQHINALNNILESGYSQKNEKGHERIEKVNGQKMIFVDHTKGDRTTSGISFIMGLRYQIKLEGNRLSTENLHDPAIEVQSLEFPE